MRKIYIDKNDTVAAVIERILSIPDEDIVLYIPRFTKLVATANNFRLMKREIDSSGKRVEIESVDEEVLQMAKSVGISAKNPFFQKNKKAFSDILSPNDRNIEDINVENASLGHSEPSHRMDAIQSIKGESKEIEFEEEETVQTDNRHKKPLLTKISRIRKKINFKLDSGSGGETEAKPVNYLKILGIGAILMGGIALLMIFLQSANVSIALEKTNWNFSGTLYASTSIKNPVFANGQVRVAGAIFEKSKNITNSYPASGMETVNKKASGKITVYNSYSSSPQPIVKDTRFVTPEGKVYRIAQGATIPGAKIVNNRIVPSSIVLTVYADKPGIEYNIGPTTFRIPGFQGTPKYDGFYAESVGPMTGGMVGTMKVATEADLVKAKGQNRKLLESALYTEIYLSIPQDVKVIDGNALPNSSSIFTVAKEDIVKEADESGNFQITTQGTLKVFGFKEADLIAALKNRLISEMKSQSSDPNESIEIELKKGAPVYSSSQVNLPKQEMTATIKFNSVWTRAFDEGKFKAMVLGKSEAELNKSLKDFPGVESVSVSLWPFWVSRVPNNLSKVAIDVN